MNLSPAQAERLRLEAERLGLTPEALARAVTVDLLVSPGDDFKRIGGAARTDLERFFCIKVYLDLTVRVRSHWRKDEKALREFGFLLTS